LGKQPKVKWPRNGYDAGKGKEGTAEQEAKTFCPTGGSGLGLGHTGEKLGSKDNGTTRRGAATF